MKKLELNQMEKFEFMFFKKNNLHNIKIIFGVVFLKFSKNSLFKIVTTSGLYLEAFTFGLLNSLILIY